MKKFDEVLEIISKDLQQFNAYKSNNSLIIKAGPGSGKTTVLSMKLARLIKEKIKSPRKVACITFSNEATNNLEKKVKSILELKNNNYYISTIHSFCLAQIIKPFSKLCDNGIDEEFTILTDDEKEQIVKTIKDNLNICDTQVSLIEMDKERNLSIDGLSQIEVESYDLAKRVAIAYEEYLTKHNLLDFISIVKHSTYMIQNESYIRKCLEARFPYILIDEYQDLGRPLHEMVLCLSKLTSIKIVAVGDSDQSIYGFNGAIPEFFDELERESSFEVIELINNYRSDQKIVDASSKILNLQKGYLSKANIKKNSEINLVRCKQDVDEQLNYIVDTLIPDSLRKGTPLNEIAILLPSNYRINEMINYLEAKDIPYYISKKEYPRTEFIIWLENCAGWLLESRKVLFGEIFDQWIVIRGLRASNSEEIIREKTKLYRVLTDSLGKSSNLYEWLRYLNLKLNFNKSLALSVRFKENIQSLNLLVNSAENGKSKTMDVKEFSTSGIQGNKVALLTRHSSKGLEFEVVIIPFVEDGSLPFYRNFDNPKKMTEEKRVLFVCISRSKSTCYLLMSKKLNGYSKNLSRFLRDFEFDQIIDF
ncbi:MULTISPECIES: ATP-dependent helicase [unclassified Exiguobacterium]|uniref:ATP-dependent helicase n=1 Tax=unclassified Exiguobacterium TaxID=2644629 RepID=UPI001BE5EF85|nr:ATP-dependent helicase [Exiguobacterium sp. s59]